MTYIARCRCGHEYLTDKKEDLSGKKCSECQWTGLWFWVGEDK